MITTVSGVCARGLVTLVAVGSMLGCGGESSVPNTATDDAVVRMMDSCVSEVMLGVANSSAVDTATDESMNYAMRTTLSGCASRALPAISSEHHCNDGGCYDSGGLGWSWEKRAAKWGCERLSADYC